MLNTKLKTLVSGLIAAVLLLMATSVDRPASAQSDERAMNFSLYWEAFKNSDYTFGLPYLHWILENAPGYPNDSDRNYRKLVEAHQALAAKASDATARRAHLDSALVAMDKAVPALRAAGAEVEEYDWIIMKGRFLQENEQHLQNLQGQVYEQYMKAYRMRPDATDEYYLNFIAAQQVERAGAGQMDKGEVMNFLNEIEPRLATDEARTYLNDQLRPMLFTTPQEEFDYLYAKYREGQRDPETTQTVFDLAVRVRNNDAVRELAPEVVKLDPNTRIYRMLAGWAAAEGDFSTATNYYERALELANDNIERRDLNYNLAAMMLQQGRFANAATYARESLRFDGNHGESYYIIGSALSRFAGGSTVQSRAINWVAADFYSRAAQHASDAKMRSDAARAASQSIAAGPTPEQYFFDPGWKKGQSVSVSTPIGSFTTTVR
jgi:tetratricopeptide (TPR) repeat protein